MTAQKSKKEQVPEVQSTESKKQEVQVIDKSEENPSTIVYVGPDLELVPQFSVFHNGLPNHLREKVKAHPVLEKLIVKLSEMPTIEDRLSRVGSKEYLLFNAAKKQLGSDA